MADRQSRDGGLSGLNQLGGLNPKRGFQRPSTGAPPRNARREKAIEFAADPLELRAVGGPLGPDEGSVLERIVAKRLSVIWGNYEIDFTWQEPVQDKSLDFAIYNRPSGKVLALEVQGAHWHGPKDFAADTERALFVIANGYDFAEVWEWEIRLGDEYLDARLMSLIGGVSRAVVPGGRNWRWEVPTVSRDLEA